MASFSESQSALTQARAALTAARTAAAQAASAKKRAAANLEQWSRTSSPTDPAARERTAALTAQLHQATSDAQAKKNAISAATRAVAQALDGFAQYSDPRRNITSLSDSLPFLLMPVRIETRFVNAGELHQLWVRIYPDDCSVDTFEETLSTSELA